MTQASIFTDLPKNGSINVLVTNRRSHICAKIFCFIWFKAGFEPIFKKQMRGATISQKNWVCFSLLLICIVKQKREICKKVVGLILDCRTKLKFTYLFYNTRMNRKLTKF